MVDDGPAPDDDAAVEQAHKLAAVIADDGGGIAPSDKVVQLIR